MYSSYDTEWLLGFVSAYLVVILAILVLTIIAEWKIFTKAKQPGWACLIPFYSDYVKYKIFWGSGWLFLIPTVGAFLIGVPVLGVILGIVIFIMHILMCKKKANAFGEGVGFAVGLFFLPTIFDMILGFSKKYEYKGIPIDGTSFKELKSKAEDIKEKVEEKEAKTTFEQPAEEKKADMPYEAPETKKVEPVVSNEPPVVDAEVEPKKD